MATSQNLRENLSQTTSSQADAPAKKPKGGFFKRMKSSAKQLRKRIRSQTIKVLRRIFLCHTEIDSTSLIVDVEANANTIVEAEMDTAAEAEANALVDFEASTVVEAGANTVVTADAKALAEAVTTVPKIKRRRRGCRGGKGRRKKIQANKSEEAVVKIDPVADANADAETEAIVERKKKTKRGCRGGKRKRNKKLQTNKAEKADAELQP